MLLVPALPQRRGARDPVPHRWPAPCLAGRLRAAPVSAQTEQAAPAMWSGNVQKIPRQDQNQGEKAEQAEQGWTRLVISRRAGSPRNSGAGLRASWTAERGSAPRQAPSTCVLAVCSGFTHQQSRQIPYNSSETGARAHEVHQQPVCGLGRSGTGSCRLSAELCTGPGPSKKRLNARVGEPSQNNSHVILGKHALGGRAEKALYVNGQGRCRAAVPIRPGERPGPGRPPEPPEEPKEAVQERDGGCQVPRCA